MNDGFIFVRNSNIQTSHNIIYMYARIVNLIRILIYKGSELANNPIFFPVMYISFVRLYRPGRYRRIRVDDARAKMKIFDFKFASVKRGSF